MIRGFGTGVLIERGHIMIHHQDHRFSLAPLPGAEGVGISGIDALLFKLLGPLLLKLLAVLHLIPLQSGPVYIRAVGHAFKMDHLRQRLIYNPVSGLSYLEGQIRILAVGGSEAVVEAADLIPKLHRKKDRRSGNIIHVLHVVIFRLIRVIQAAVIPAGAVAPDNSAGLLQPSVGINQLGADHSDRRIRLDQRDQRRQPARRYLGVIV